MRWFEDLAKLFNRSQPAIAPLVAIEAEQPVKEALVLHSEENEKLVKDQAKILADELKNLRISSETFFQAGNFDGRYANRDCATVSFKDKNSVPIIVSIYPDRCTYQSRSITENATHFRKTGQFAEVLNEVIVDNSPGFKRAAATNGAPALARNF